MPKPFHLLHADERSSSRGSSEGQHVVAAALFLVAWLSFIVFVVLYRAPLPTDAFAALSMELVARADAGVAR